MRRWNVNLRKGSPEICIFNSSPGAALEKGCGWGLPRIWSRAVGEALGGGDLHGRGAGEQAGSPGPTGGKGRRRRRSVLSLGRVLEERWPWSQTSLKPEAWAGKGVQRAGCPGSQGVGTRKQKGSWGEEPTGWRERPRSSCKGADAWRAQGVVGSRRGVPRLSSGVDGTQLPLHLH